MLHALRVIAEFLGWLVYLGVISLVVFTIWDWADFRLKGHPHKFRRILCEFGRHGEFSPENVNGWKRCLVCEHPAYSGKPWTETPVERASDFYAERRLVEAENVARVRAKTMS